MAPRRCGGRLDDLVTDRSDASGTGYFDPITGGYRFDLLRRALGHEPALPRVLDPAGAAGEGSGAVLRPGAVPSPGCADNAGAVLGLGARPGDVVVSIGTSGVFSAVSETSTADPAGIIAGFADATGRFLPLVCTLNAARVLDTVGRLLGVGLAELALRADPGADGLVLVPYLEGERTPDRPTATGALHGITLGGFTREGLARAAVEGVLCGLADGLDALRTAGVACERGCCWSAVARVRRPCSGSRRACSGCRCWSPSRGSTWRSGRPGRRPGSCPARPNRRSGRSPDGVVGHAELQERAPRPTRVSPSWIARASPVASITSSQPHGRSSLSAEGTAAEQPSSRAVSNRSGLMSTTSTAAAPTRLASCSIISTIVPEP